MSIEAIKKAGLGESEVLRSREQYGRNLITPPEKTPWWKLYLEKFKDPIIIILLAATVISLVFGVIHGEYTESVGIILAVLIATGVGFWQEYDAERKFEAMKSDKDYEPVKVRRSGVVSEIPKDELVVGDVVLVAAGDEIPADLLLYHALDLKVSEAAMTGEAIAVAKYPTNETFRGSGFAPNQLLRGTTVEQGLGEGEVTAVGDATELGKTTRQASEETENKTPLEVSLNALAEKINVAGFVVSGLMILILNLMHWDFGFGDVPFQWTWDTLFTEVRFLMEAVVVIIVAVPEGLPLAVTLALAFSMKTMAKEHNLVRKMHACETIGAVNLIFTDKTGTLTQNRMSVVDVDVKDENRTYLDFVGAINSSANWSGGDVVIGNPTEGAILRAMGKELSEKFRTSWTIRATIPFSSAYKYMVTYAVHGKTGEKAIVIKGAPEVVARIIGDDSFLGKVAAQQARGRRAIAAAVFAENDFKIVRDHLEKGETLPSGRYLGTWFIEDPIRPDVPGAIEKCYGAGIDVVMMTGDNLKTGAEIGRQAGFKDIWAVEAKDFDGAVADGYDGSRTYPNVIARCTPTQKLDILKQMQAKGMACAMTGDGVNDSPSLNHADVGIAMGSGTSVAKEAADIILLDDAFPSIVTGVKWGRSLFKNIKNFLYLQLSINVSACFLALFAPIVGVEVPFTVTQFLWINLVMDSLAAIALASEPADEAVLLEQPRDRHKFIIDRPLATAIFGFGGFVWLLCTFVLWGMHHTEILSGLGLRTVAALLGQLDLTVFFAFYMLINWWNLFNARVIGKNRSALDGVFSNAKFVAIALFVLVTTIVIVQVGGKVFSTHPLSAETWLYIILLTSPILIVREVYYHLSRLFAR